MTSPQYYVILLVLLSATPALGFWAYCPSHCRQDGTFVNRFLCSDPNTPVYCCGNLTVRFCCNNPDLSIPDDVTDIYDCPKSSWWMLNWQILVGTLSGLIIVCLLAACCYYTCGQIKSDRNPLDRMRRRRNRDVEDPTSGTDFSHLPPPPIDPVTGQPLNTLPPAYDTLPKDPPTYNESQGIAPDVTSDSANQRPQNEQSSGGGGSDVNGNTPTTIINSVDSRVATGNDNSHEDSPPPYSPTSEPPTSGDTTTSLATTCATATLTVGVTPPTTVSSSPPLSSSPTTTTASRTTATAITMVFSTIATTMSTISLPSAKVTSSVNTSSLVLATNRTEADDAASRIGVDNRAFVSSDTDISAIPMTTTADQSTTHADSKTREGETVACSHRRNNVKANDVAGTATKDDVTVNSTSV